MYTATKSNFITSGEAISAQRVAECIGKAKEIGKKKKAELELKLISLLLVIGNLIVLCYTDKSVMNFFGYMLESLIVFSAIIIIAKDIKSFLSFMKKNKFYRQ